MANSAWGRGDSEKVFGEELYGKGVIGIKHMKVVVRGGGQGN